MERLPQALWNWPSRRDPAPVQTAPLADEDVETALPMLATIVGADDALLELYCDTEAGVPTRIIRSRETRSPSGKLDAALALSEARYSGPLPVQPEWVSRLIDGRLWHVLRVPVHSRRARSTVILDLLFRPAPASARILAGDKLGALRPLIETYLKLWQRTRTGSRGASGLRCALDAAETGIILLNRGAKISFANKAAAGLLQGGDPVKRVGDALTTSDFRQSLALQAALGHAIGSNADDGTDKGNRRRAPMLTMEAQRSNRSLVLLVIPADAPAAEPQDVAAIVYLLDPQADRTHQLQVVCNSFGLWPVEARLVCLLSEGKTLQEAAQAIRIKDQTARTYLKQIFLKTGTRRQADLVRVMLSSMLPIERTIEPEWVQERAEIRPGNARR